MRKRNGRVALAAAAAAIAAAPGVASAAAWSPLVELTSVGTGREISTGAMAATDAGDALAAWLMAGAYIGDVEAAVRDRGGGWTPGAVADPDAPHSTGGLVVAADARGGHAAAWFDQAPGASPRLLVARREIGDPAWGAPEVVDTGAATAFGAPAMAVDRGGRATILWAARDDAGASRLMVASSERGEAWRRAVLATNVDATAPVRLAVARDRTLVAQWAGVRGRALVAVSPRPGAWSPARALPRAMAAPVATAAPGGRVMAVGADRVRFGTRVFASRSAAGRPFTPPQVLDRCPRGIDLAVVPAALDGFRRTTAAWSCTRELRGVRRTWIRAATAPAGGAFRRPATVAVGRDHGPVAALGVGVQGHAVIAWPERNLALRGLRAAVRRSPAARWSPVERVTDARRGGTFGVLAAVDARGRATVMLEVPEHGVFASARGGR